ncbi:uncharacterized protein FPRN_15192 [Fusarium proliferatum]|nr:uncharacterized protein FPRN_15192 [Fusarium proliferatum]
MLSKCLTHANREYKDILRRP